MTVRITGDTPAHEIDRVLRAYDADVFRDAHGCSVHLYPRLGHPRSGQVCAGCGPTLWSALNRALREVARG